MLIDPKFIGSISKSSERGLAGRAPDSEQGKKVDCSAPWARQLQNDIKRLEPFLEGLCRDEFSINDCFDLDSDLNRATTNFDFALLRNASLSACVE